MLDALTVLEDRLKELSRKSRTQNYCIPKLWIETENDEANSKVEVKPFHFFIERIKRIHSLAKTNKSYLPEKDWTKHAVIYNLFIRYSTAYDHDSNGKINLDFDEYGLRETGTFLKAIAMLPYLHSLGINTIYLLPITAIGKDGRKGELGSPYAIRNPYKLDNNLSEPVLDVDIDTQFKAFVEASHLLGLNVVLEFVFRTASKDSDLALEHPEWFYWIDEKTKDRKHGSDDGKRYGPPIFTEKEIYVIKEKIANSDFIKLPEPNDNYKQLFKDVPNKVARVEDRIVGVIGEVKKNACRIPGAFADWPPDDIQPAWSDVTYLRLYGHRSFNYIAYNTVRMYEQRLEQNKYRLRSLWDNICNIIPYYQQHFDIDGVMIDMGHSLPSELRAKMIQAARKHNPDFAFWEENFELTKKSVKDGYDATLGYLPFDAHLNNKLKELLEYLADKGSPIPYFGTAETHNTARTASRNGGIAFSKMMWAIVNFMPSIPLMLSGFELGESSPINTGLHFSKEEQNIYPLEELPLFSLASHNWESEQEFSAFIRKISNIRLEFIDVKENFNPKTMVNLMSSSVDIIVFRRIFRWNNFIFIGNMNREKELYFSIKINERFSSLNDIISERHFTIANGWLIANLKPLEFICGSLE